MSELTSLQKCKKLIEFNRGNRAYNFDFLFKCVDILERGGQLTIRSKSLLDKLYDRLDEIAELRRKRNLEGKPWVKTPWGYK